MVITPMACLATSKLPSPSTVTVTGMPTQICGAVKRVFTDISVSGLCSTASGIDTLTLKFIN